MGSLWQRKRGFLKQLIYEVVEVTDLIITYRASELIFNQGLLKRDIDLWKKDFKRLPTKDNYNASH